jgi:hypothetical protein
MNTVNEILVSAHSLGHACFDNAFEILSLQISRLFWTSHYEKVHPCHHHYRVNSETD